MEPTKDDLLAASGEVVSMLVNELYTAKARVVALSRYVAKLEEHIDAAGPKEEDAGDESNILDIPAPGS